MTAYTPHWIINGQTMQGWWRIDDGFSEKTGVDFLNSPVAIVPDRADAVRIAALPKLLEACRRAREALIDWQGMECSCPDDSGSCTTCTASFPALQVLDAAIAAAEGK